MTKKLFFIVLTISFYFSCKNHSNKSVVNNNIIETEKKETDLNLTDKKQNKNIRKKVKVLSVKETLISSDYLTTVMTVETDDNKRLVFLDMHDFEKLVDKEITIEYQLISDPRRLLLCFDCSSYSKEIKLYDVTAFYSKIEYKELQLKKYIEDEGITINSTFEMVDKNDKIEIFNTNDDDMILDSLKMKSSFHKYGITTKIYPELVNRAELEKLIK